MKPSNFARVFPFDSYSRTSECETIAFNIMRIIARTGDLWRTLSWSEYTKERKKDGEYTAGEQSFFARTISHTQTEDAARKFSPKWRELS